MKNKRKGEKVIEKRGRLGVGVLRLASLAAFGLALVSPCMGVSAWGPDWPQRGGGPLIYPTGADKVRFNSMDISEALKAEGVDSLPAKEWDFVRVAEHVGAGGSRMWTNNIAVEPGKAYDVMIYYHNNADDKWNYIEGEDKQRIGVARGTRVRTMFPMEIPANTPANSEDGEVYGEITAVNADPGKVWDEAYFRNETDKTIRMRYIPSTATLHNGTGNEGLNNAALDFDEMTNGNGQLIGYKGGEERVLNGIVPGCFKYSGYVTYTLIAEQDDVKFSKSVSLDGLNYVEKVKARPGDTVYFKLRMENAGMSDLMDMIFDDDPADGLSLVSGSVKGVNSNGKEFSFNDAIMDGINTGVFGPKTWLELSYQMVVDSDYLKDKECGEYELVNDAMIGFHTTGGDLSMTDGASVVLNKPCEEKPVVMPVEPQKPMPVESLPKTGPVEVALSMIAIACLVTGGIYWYRSEREVEAMNAMGAHRAPKTNKMASVEGKVSKSKSSTKKSAAEVAKDLQNNLGTKKKSK